MLNEVKNMEASIMETPESSEIQENRLDGDEIQENQEKTECSETEKKQEAEENPKKKPETPPKQETMLEKPALQGAERRLAARSLLKVPITVQIGGSTLKGKTVDLSVSGMALTVAHVIPTGTSCQLHCNLPAVNGRYVPVVLNAKIMNCVMQGMAGFRHGVQFIGLKPDQKRILEALCS
jgi:hypothetical protein